MTKLGYSVSVDPKVSARGIGRELPVSRKRCYELCRALRGMMAEDAKHLLDEIIELRRPVRFRRYVTSVGHKRGMGAGRYPVKPARFVKRLIESVQSNAEQQGMDGESMRIAHIAVHPGPKRKKNRPRAYGRSTPWVQETVHVELVLEEVKEE